jgi:hypothetical protein
LMRQQVEPVLQFGLHSHTDHHVAGRATFRTTA